MKRKQLKDSFASEDDLITFIRGVNPSQHGIISIGDDAAVISTGPKKLAITTDSLVEGVHFKLEWITPLYLGKKSGRSNLSDIAAMGASPKYVLVSLVLPHRFSTKIFISKLYQGFQWVFAPYNAPIIGGNISSGTHVVITLTIIGELPNSPLLRSSARVGDAIFCTGTLGNAAWEVSQLYQKRKKRMDVVPPDRIAFASALSRQDIATACLDISDGLSVDLTRLCQASRVGAIVYADSLPVEKKLNNQLNRYAYILNGGEDYELLFTVPNSKRKLLGEVSRTLDTPFTEIGRIQKSQSVEIQYGGGTSVPFVSEGWDHVRSKQSNVDTAR